MLGRRRYREMPEKELLAKRLPGVCLDTRYLLRDLLGCGILMRVETPSGSFIRLVKRA